MIQLPPNLKLIPTSRIFTTLLEGLQKTDTSAAELASGLLDDPTTHFDVASFISLLAYCQMLERRVEMLESKRDVETYERNEMRGRLEYRIDREAEDLQERLQDLTLAVQELQQRCTEHG